MAVRYGAPKVESVTNAVVSANCFLSEVHRRNARAAALTLPLHKRSENAFHHAAASRCSAPNAPYVFPNHKFDLY